MPSRELDSLLLRNYATADGITERYERELAKRYKAAFDEIDRSLAKLYAQVGDKPTIAEARRYGRLEKLHKAIADEYYKLTKELIRGTRDTSAAVWSQGVYGTEWAYDQAIGASVKWPVLSVEAIRASVWSGDSGEQFSERFRNWSTRDVLTFQNKITSALAMGKGYAATARVVRDTVNATYNQAIRIVRTESTRNYTQGHLEVYDKLAGLGIKARKRWVATLDTRTRDSHGILDGEYADNDGLFHVHGASAEGPGLFGIPEEDINCRCRVVEEIDELAPSYRRIRGEGIVPYQSFTQWASERGWSPTKGWDIQSKAKLTESQYRKY